VKLRKSILQTTTQAADGESGTDVILESISDGVFTVDDDWRVKSFNRAAEEITGIAREEAFGKRCWEVFRASVCEDQCALRHTMETGKPVVNRSCYIIDSKGQRIPISVSTGLLRAKDGTVSGGVETFRDLTLVEELRKELEGRFQIGNMVTRSPAMRPILEVLPALAGSSSTVLLQGETGTGKEVLAHMVTTKHAESTVEEQFVLRTIGRIHTPFLEAAGTPVQSSMAKGARGTVQIFPEYAKGLSDLEGFERIWLVYWFDRAVPDRLTVKPYLDDRLHGVFATRAPCRPNRLGISCVQLIEIKGNILEVADVDVLDGTPLLDIKPYCPRFDLFEVSRSGWVDEAPPGDRVADDRFSQPAQKKG